MSETNLNSLEKLRRSLPYRPCVGIMVLNEAGKVWAGRRLLASAKELIGTTKRWQMPQGGIDKNEEPETAARRELWEETGMESVSLLAQAPDWINYDLPDAVLGSALKGKYRGQTMRWFAYRFNGDEAEIRINPPPGDEHAEFDRWDWVNMKTLPDIIVPFKKPLYSEVVHAFRHLQD